MSDNQINFTDKSNKILSFSLEGKKILWLSEANKYIVVTPPVDKIIEQLYEGTKEKLILEYCKVKLELSFDDATHIIQQVKYNLNNIQDNVRKNTIRSNFNPKGTNFNCTRFYKIYGFIFYIEYETNNIEHLIHPKIAHLEIHQTTGFDHHFQLFKINNNTALTVNCDLIGTWRNEEIHFMTGKVSMEILQKIYQNKENDWMAVFHASGISNGKKSIMFLGDSGNGKSTLAAILMANGFDVLADDFLPVESKNSHLCSFPAAISVKKQAIDILSEIFPELNDAREYSYPTFDKTVRYLSNPDWAIGIPKKVPCKALVFIKYDPGSDLKFNNLPKDIAFQKLIPDSWISPLGKNAERFLDWFAKLPCYQLTYSDNRKMADTVKKLFQDDF